MVYYQNPPDKSLYCRYLLIYFINFLIFFVCFCLFFTITITPNPYLTLLLPLTVLKFDWMDFERVDFERVPRQILKISCLKFR